MTRAAAFLGLALARTGSAPRHAREQEPHAAAAGAIRLGEGAVRLVG